MRVSLRVILTVRCVVEGMEVSRSYTVVPPSLSADHPDPALREGRRLYLMIKIYQFYGALTPIIGKLKPGQCRFTREVPMKADYVLKKWLLSDANN